MRIGIVITTYFRPDRKSKDYLIRALNSINNQIHKDYQIYVIGDAYSELYEFHILSKLFSHAKFINLPKSIEREKYPFGDMRLFCVSGLTPSLAGIDLALKDGIEYICHLDHDDWWESNHLELINQVIETQKPLFVCTLSSYGGSHLPFIEITNNVYEFIPVAEGLICSSTCIHYSDTLLRAKDCFAEVGVAIPGDADLWTRLAMEMQATGKKGFIIASLTCHHDEEGYSIHQ